MTAADRAARSEHGDGPALGEEAREAVRAALVAEMGCGDPATPQGRQDLRLLGEMADGVLYALRPHVAALLTQARAAGAAEVWSEYAIHDGRCEKMPRWDQDKAVVANGWAAGRCGNCGEKLPS